MPYRLTQEAEDDLAQIYRRGLKEFGEAQADKYFNAFFDRFEVIAKAPYQLPAIDHVMKGLRKSVCGQDTIYYEVADSADDTVLILFILGRQDIKLRLKQWQP